MTRDNFSLLNEEQRRKLRNITASARIAGTPISDMARTKIIDTMMGKSTIEDAICEISDYYTNKHNDDGDEDEKTRPR